MGMAASASTKPGGQSMRSARVISRTSAVALTALWPTRQAERRGALMRADGEHRQNRLEPGGEAKTSFAVRALRERQWGQFFFTQPCRVARVRLCVLERPALGGSSTTVGDMEGSSLHDLKTRQWRHQSPFSQWN